MQKGWWSGFVVGILVAFVVFSAIFYIGSSITGNLVLDLFHNNKNTIKPVDVTQQSLSLNCYNAKSKCASSDKQCLANFEDKSDFKCYVKVDGKQSAKPVDISFYQSTDKAAGDPEPGGRNVRSV